MLGGDLEREDEEKFVNFIHEKLKLNESICCVHNYSKKYWAKKYTKDLKFIHSEGSKCVR